MGFKENLKAELTYSGLLVKELSALSGINKRTIDNYLNTHNCMPSADAAVRIARVLRVSVEYLITGNEQQEQKSPLLFPHPRFILKNLELLNKRDQQIVFNLIKSLQGMENSEKKSGSAALTTAL